MDFTAMRNARKAAGITQDDLAKILGINRATISKYESGQIMPSLGQLGKIAKALDTTVYEMVGPDWDGWNKIDMSDAFAIKKAPTQDGERQKETVCGVTTDWILGVSDDKKAPGAAETTPGDELRDILVQNFYQLNQEGRERLVDTSDDMVRSGKYIKSDQNQLGKAQGA